MQLADYMTENGLRDDAIAKACGVDRSMVSRWRTRKTLPSPANMQRIATATAGHVTANDFYEAIGVEAVRAELAREVAA